MKRMLHMLAGCFATLLLSQAALAETPRSGPVSGAAADTQDLSQMSVADLEAQAPGLHPAALYVLAARLLSQGRGHEAANWMYAGQLRYRFLLSASSATGASDDGILYSALSEQVGRPVNEYIAGDVDEWMAAMTWALDWDAAHDNPITSKREHAAVLKEIRDGLVTFRDSLDGRREEIAKSREENGLPNR